jgi:hypothetical protein
LTSICPGENIRLEKPSESTGNADNRYSPVGTCKFARKKDKLTIVPYRSTLDYFT